MSGSAHHIVIVGAGFGGLEAVHCLRGAPVRITVVDRRNHHLFQGSFAGGGEILR